MPVMLMGVHQKDCNECLVMSAAGYVSLKVDFGDTLFGYVAGSDTPSKHVAKKAK